MSPRLLVTAGLLPLVAVALAVAPMLTRSARSPSPEVNPLVEPVPPQTPAAPTGPVHVTAVPDRDVIYASGDRTVRVKVELWADPGQRPVTVPTDLVVVLDRSGSMSGDKILDARAAAAELVSQLGPDDRFGLVSFDDAPRVDVRLGSTPRSAWAAAIGRIQAGGSTGMVQGLEVGLDQIAPTPGRARRVVLISDGQPDTEVGLDALTHRAAVGETPLTAIGIGPDYNEDLLQHLADSGAGNFYWVTRGPDLQNALASELSTARETVASGLSLAVGHGARLVDGGGVPVVEGAVSLGTLYAGQHRTLWLTVSVPAGATAPFDLGTLDATWHTPSDARASLDVDLPAIGISTDPQLAYKHLGDAWADSVVTDQYNDLRTRVSAAVRAGDQDAANAAITQYTLDNGEINSYAQNPKVTDNLADVRQLQQEVNGTFVGEDQAERQNLWSKGTRVDAYNKRRVGQIRTTAAPELDGPSKSV